MHWPIAHDLRRVTFLAAAIGAHFNLQAAAAASLPFEAAYFHQADVGSVITLFPSGPGKAADIALPADLPRLINLISFAPDGRSAYLQIPSAEALKLSDALVKVEFGPVRQAPVPGSAGLSDISSLTISPQASRIFVSALGGEDHLCGTYEIDPAAGTHRALLVSDGPGCGGALGNISPDGKRLVSTQGRQLSLVNLVTGASKPLGNGRAWWSPDGRWIATASRGQIVLIDAAKTSQRKKLGASGVDDHLVWSPDSKYLLFAKRDRRCFLMGDAESLVIVDVETGRASMVESSRCKVTSSALGWVDPVVLR